jgi:hypothetical protein
VCLCERSNWVVSVRLEERERAPPFGGGERGRERERERPPPPLFKGPRALALCFPHLPPFPKKTKYFAPPAQRPCCSSSSVVRLLHLSRHQGARSNALSPLLTPFPPLLRFRPSPTPQAARPRRARSRRPPLALVSDALCDLGRHRPFFRARDAKMPLFGLMMPFLSGGGRGACLLSAARARCVATFSSSPLTA